MLFDPVFSEMAVDHAQQDEFARNGSHAKRYAGFVVEPPIQGENIALQCEVPQAHFRPNRAQAA